MVPNGSAYANFPSFANNGTKTPPGGSTESAKYALGMVPADTFPAEWANYLFHGATAGITRLNSDTGSIKKEINTVLECENITPDAESYSQLYCALTKIRDEAVALAYPVGTVYMNAKCATLPDALQAIGTWCAIDGRFLRACASRIGCTGGGSVTLAVCNLPSHCHTTPAHCHTGPSHCHSITDHKHSGCVGSHCHTFSGSASHSHQLQYSTQTSTKVVYYWNGQPKGVHGIGNTGNSAQDHIDATGCIMTDSRTISIGGNTGACAPGFTGGSMCTSVNTGAAGSGNTGTASPTTCNTGSGCAFDIVPSYRDVAMWYRDA